MQEFIAEHFNEVATLAKLAAVIGGVLFTIGQLTWLERKVSAWIQDRVGPNRVGPFGLLQFLADGIKFLTKEEIVPAHANKFLYNLAPVLAVTCGLATAAVIPFGPDLKLHLFGADRTIALAVAPDVSIALLWILSLTSIGVYAIMLAGWASNSKYPQIGGLRSTAQIISYEIAMGLAIVPVIMKTGSLSLRNIIDAQSGWHWNIFDVIPNPITMAKTLADGSVVNVVVEHAYYPCFPQFVGFVIFMCAAFAETNRLPFDLPEGEAELVGGYHTEYSGMKFASFFMAEYANMITASMMMTILFLGGWQLPGFTPDGSWPMVLASVAIFSAKVFAFLFFFIWVRWTLPRFRYDQLMKLGWVYFIPLAMINLAAAAVWQMLSVRGA